MNVMSNPFSPCQVLWFKRDLRLDDHQPLFRAARAGAVLPLFVIEPGYWTAADASPRQWRFVRQGLIELDQGLRQLGAPGLWLGRGEVVEVLAALQRQFPIAGLWSHEETGNDRTYRRDRAVAGYTRRQGIPWQEFRQDGVVRRLRSRDGWAEHWQQFIAAPRWPQPQSPSWVLPTRLVAETVFAPAAAPITAVLERWAPFAHGADPCPGAQPGGRGAALERLQSFLTERGRDYARGMSSPRTAAAVCSRLSPHLAWGTISVREVWQGLKRHQARGDVDPAWGRSLRAFESRLAWQSHFLQKLETEPRLEFANLHPSLDGWRDAVDAELLAAWAEGRTGLPFVDACMRMLRATGWINFRMRAMLAAIAGYHLWQPWRAAGLHLARQFVDYEPGIHWSQMQMQSGSTGINAFRIYNPIKQSRDQDPDGKFIRQWLPELEPLPGEWIHEPWRLPISLQRRHGCYLGRDYPAPVVDPEQAARVARERLKQAYRAPGAREAALRVYLRHGSRQRREPLPRFQRPAGEQLGLFE